MRKPVRPFSVELRRTGRKAKTTDESRASDTVPEAPAPIHWPEPDEPHASDARRAADALFARPEAEPSARLRHDEVTQGRRVLQALDEQDPIARLLEEEEAQRPRRGRRAPPQISPTALTIAARVQPVAPLIGPRKIEGYRRGRIYARYARRTELALGAFWRKRPHPAW